MSKSLKTILICTLLVAATVGVYWHALDNDFIVYYDDGDYVTLNQHVQTGLNARSIIWAFTAAHSANWHPLTWLSHMVDFGLYRLNPSGHHLTNVLIHAMNVLLLFLILRRMTRSTWKSAFVAALFALHPLHVESVAWIAERKDVLSTFFWLMTMWAYARYAESPSLRRYLPVPLFLACSLMSKPMAVTLPVVLVIMDYWPLGRLDQRPRPLGRLILEKVPLLGLSVLSCVVTFMAQSSFRAVRGLDSLSIGARISNALVAYVSYIGKMLWPTDLSVMYPHPGESLQVLQTGGAALFLLLITLTAIWARRNHPYFTAGWLWYLVTLIPVIGLVQVGSQAMADRYTYIPLTGLFIAIAWGVPQLLGDTRKSSGSPPEKLSMLRSTSLAVSAIVLLCVLAAMTAHQVGYWKDSITLFRHAIGATKDNYDSHSCLAAALEAEGRYDEAIEHCNIAIRIHPDYPDAHCNLGTLLASKGKIDEAIEQQELAVRIDPQFAEAYYNLGKAFSIKGLLGKAESAYKTSLQLEPDSADAHNNLGNVYLKQGRAEEAVSEYEAALRLNPGLAQARTNLEAARSGQGKDADTIALSNEHYNAGVEFQMQNKIDDAIREYGEAVRVRPDFAQAHNNLALAYFDKGSFALAWKEVGLCRKYDLEPHPDFVKTLEEKMPDPATGR